MAGDWFGRKPRKYGLVTTNTTRKAIVSPATGLRWLHWVDENGDPKMELEPGQLPSLADILK